jgi:hypothetical protein
MHENPVLAVMEMIAILDPAGLKIYQERASALIGPLGGVMLGTGGKMVQGVLIST